LIYTAHYPDIIYMSILARVLVIDFGCIEN